MCTFEGKSSGLAKVGPLRSTGDHYPVWYEDTNGVRLELCLDPADPRCAIPADHIPDPFAPVSFPNNFPEESFYWMAEAEMTTTAGDAALILALEAAWSAEIVRPGDSVVFGRIRHRVDIGLPGTYRITHPYGVDIFTVDVPDRRAINWTEDVGVAAMNFHEVKKSRVGPFLVSQAYANRTDWVGDFATPGPVTGSPYDTNFYRIESVVWDEERQEWVRGGPAIGTGSNPCPDDPTDTRCIQTDSFVVMGKRAQIAGVDADRVTYKRDSEGKAKISIFASSLPNQEIEVRFPNAAGTAPGESKGYLARGEDQNATRYYGELVLANEAPPANLYLSNRTDSVVDWKRTAVTDEVRIKSAVFNRSTRVLRIEAESSDSFEDAMLRAVGLGPLSEEGIATFITSAPPPSVTVESCFGGEATAPVLVEESAAPPTVALAADLPTAKAGDVVTLVASGKDFTTVSWSQIAGYPVALELTSPFSVSFVAPPQSGTFRFQATAEGPGGIAVAYADVEVTNNEMKLDIDAPSVAARGSRVEFNGMESTGVETWSWVVDAVNGEEHHCGVSSVCVNLTGADTATPAFDFPLEAWVRDVTVALTVGGAPGTEPKTATFTVTAEPDTLTVVSATYKGSRSEWRVEGTASVTAGNQVTIYIGDPKDGVILANAVVDPATGGWLFRQRNSTKTADGSTRLSVVSRAGGVLLDQQVTIE